MMPAVLRRGLIRPRRDDEFFGDVIAGLGAAPKSVPSQWLWDERGSQLFERICDTAEHYVARAERELLERHAREIADAIGPHAVLVEVGAGNAERTRALLDWLDEPERYVPVEVRRATLDATAEALRREYRGLDVEPIAADFAREAGIPHRLRASSEGGRTTVLLGSGATGNLHPHQAVSVLARAALGAGAGGSVLALVDLKKPKRTIEAAYDDRQGATAAFNRNVLARINREIGATFDLTRFTHKAPYDPIRGRVEMRLVSDVAQRVLVGGCEIHFARGEWIVTEHSYKYDLAEFQQLARRAGLTPVRAWRDEKGRVSLHELAVR
jgi:dimethylhistidine N-methyltransferase